MKIGIVAGEASGDILGAGLIHALKTAYTNLTVSGLGGPQMIEAGCHSLFNMERLSVMGLVEPLFRLPELFKIRRGLYEHFIQDKPDIFIGIDSPDFNLGLELKLKKAGIPVVHYVSPSVWAWRQKRIFKITKATDLVLTLFPFEVAFYEKHQVHAKCVGHPLADLIPLHIDKMAAREKLNLDKNKTYIAILPGSRKNELTYLGEPFVKTAKLCWQAKPHIEFITSAVNQNRLKEFKQTVEKICPNLPIHFFQGQSHEVMAASDMVLVTSGTATLETLLFKRPMVIAYRMANLTYQLAKYLVKTPFIGLPNLLANEMLVPEFIQEKANPENLSAALMHYLDHPSEIAKLEKKFLALHENLRCSANQKAAEEIIHLTS